MLVNVLALVRAMGAALWLAFVLASVRAMGAALWLAFVLALMRAMSSALGLAFGLALLLTFGLAFCASASILLRLRVSTCLSRRPITLIKPSYFIYCGYVIAVYIDTK